MFGRKFFVWGLVALSVVACSTKPPPSNEAETPKNVIFFISDGCGPASFTMARDYVREHLGGEGLAIDAIQVGGVRTFSEGNQITDSAASATAYACGIKTRNGAVAVDTEGRSVATVLEGAEARGMATGLVVTSTITHATPAAFSSHVSHRRMAAEIAAQQLEQGIEVMFGGGRRDFLPDRAGGNRTDGRDLLDEARAKGYQVVLDRTTFDGSLQTPVLGLFADGHLAYEIDREAAATPSLAEMTARALDLLKDDPDGFFLMVEGSRIDHAGHGNDAAAHLHDILAFDAAIAVALDFAQQHGETLIISTSDHETGGLTLGRNIEEKPTYSWQPSQLARVQHSNEHMGAALRQGADWEALLHEQAGLDDLSDTEKAEIVATYEAGDPRAFFYHVNRLISHRAALGWTSFGHTGVDVNLYAIGPGATHFVGNHDNTHIGQVVADLLGLDLGAISASLGPPPRSE